MTKNQPRLTQEEMRLLKRHEDRLARKMVNAKSIETIWLLLLMPVAALVIGFLLLNHSH